ncbi:acyltransferase family protein [Rosistilla oblonga]|uniref:acyltransferase family protein n=1 Tax=Rosistilla oblonga TaxID=2527990 RepID=UPI003A96F965
MQPSQELKQSFRTASLWATALVVLIHYRSAAATGGNLNGWLQEILINGIARIAVPVFAFAAGFFYFLTFTGSYNNYLAKLRQRAASLLVPYLLISLIALASWSTIQMMLGKPTQLEPAQFFSRILLHPLAEQLWFLRDLMLLVIAAPLIQFAVRRAPRITLGILAVLWTMEWQPAPIVAGWYALNVETLLGFTLGCWAVTRIDLLESLIRAPKHICFALLATWSLLLATRVAIDPSFDNWYVRDFTTLSLLLQKAAIATGCLGLLSIARRIENQRLSRLAEFSFFVYLVHEFPMREVLRRVTSKIVGEEFSFWIAAPTAIVCSLLLAQFASRYTPTLIAVLTGGRTMKPVSLSAARPRWRY